jgi:hypothetical protein
LPVSDSASEQLAHDRGEPRAGEALLDAQRQLLDRALD